MTPAFPTLGSLQGVSIYQDAAPTEVMGIQALRKPCSEEPGRQMGGSHRDGGRALSRRCVPGILPPTFSGEETEAGKAKGLPVVAQLASS